MLILLGILYSEFDIVFFIILKFIVISHCFVVVDIWYQLVVMEQFVFGNGTWPP